MILRRLTEQVSGPQCFQAGMDVHHMDPKVLLGAVGLSGMSQEALVVLPFQCSLKIKYPVVHLKFTLSASWSLTLLVKLLANMIIGKSFCLFVCLLTVLTH